MLAFHASVNVVGAAARPSNEVTIDFILAVARLRFYVIEIRVYPCDLVWRVCDCFSSFLTGECDHPLWHHSTIYGAIGYLKIMVP